MKIASLLRIRFFTNARVLCCVLSAAFFLGLTAWNSPRKLLADELQTQDSGSNEAGTNEAGTNEDGNVAFSLKLVPSAPESAAGDSKAEKLNAEKPPTQAPTQGSYQRTISDESTELVKLSFLPQIGTATPPASDRQSPREECPGGQDDSNEEAAPLPVLPGDIPLDQDEHPFDVPAAQSTAPQKRLESSSPSAGESEAGGVQNLEINRRIESLLQYYRDHPENIVRRGPWALMHVILPFGVEAEVVAGHRNVNAIGWLCHNGISARQRMFQPTQTGFRPNKGPGVQGHDGQFLAILAQSRVKSDYPLSVGKRKFSIKDLIRYEMATCREKSELTFKLIAFSHYLAPQQTWNDNRGRRWSIEKIVAEELAQPINGAACGGTHRLMGLTCAVLQRQAAGLPMTGHFSRAQIFLDDFVAYTMGLQNPDGSFSTEWFERRANEPNVDRKIQTTGHILEWLVYTLPDEHLTKPEIVSAVNFLLDTLGENPQRDWPIGPRGHSLRALAIYQQRVLLDDSEVTPVQQRVTQTEAGALPR